MYEDVTTITTKKFLEPLNESNLYSQEIQHISNYVN